MDQPHSTPNYAAHAHFHKQRAASIFTGICKLYGIDETKTHLPNEAWVQNFHHAIQCELKGEAWCQARDRLLTESGIPLEQASTFDHLAQAIITRYAQGFYNGYVIGGISLQSVPAK
jgi:hypothetical protein